MGKLFFCISAFFKAVDLTTTYVFVTKFGSKVEWNPIFKFSLDEIGLCWSLVLSGLWVFLMLLLLFKIDKRRLWVIVSTLLGFVALANTIMYVLTFGV